MAASKTRTANLLFVDMAAGICRPLCERFQRAGYHAIEVADSDAAISQTALHAVDLAIVGVTPDTPAAAALPGVLRRVAEVCYLPVMVLASGLDEARRCAFLDDGADDVLDPNMPFSEVLARTRSLLRVQELHGQLAQSHAYLLAALRREQKLRRRLRRDNESLQWLATTDPLTHVQNIRSFQQLLDHEFANAARYSRALSMLMIDVDHFKVVNDTHGHPSGDYVLKELAVIFTQSVRESDVVARTGGEEFSVLLPQADSRQAHEFAERIRQDVFHRNFIVYGHDIHVTISLGSATFPSDAEIIDAGMLAYLSDQALLVAKEAGRDQVVAVSGLDRALRQRLRRQYLQRDQGELLPPPTGDRPEKIKILGTGV